ncbi:dihydrofolate reductase family protein [Nocardioides sp. TF02-7]|uniref:dihydrofolate reductase family protein n=1 Tax=Nocardioides sp. TF02-7 TaxID=2917724 RepID=UPI001F0572C9|nr:dihydrofolate reductase family protein [Nocardioides sp. TF02-7]UMG92079.1 dihydrofolate reductase family protein [Nocardioides sp. TF02-7]
MNAQHPITRSTSRRVVANLALTLDGSFHGAGGPDDLAPIVRYAVTDVARNHMARFISTATTAVLGRVNAEGFLGFWPALISSDGVDPRDEAYAKWLVATEKVVLSTTLTDAPGENSRVRNAPAAEVVAELRDVGVGDILVNSSPSVIQELLAADEVDRLELLVVPELAGGGTRLFEAGLPATRWTLARHEAGEQGELSLTYDRAR